MTKIEKQSLDNVLKNFEDFGYKYTGELATALTKAALLVERDAKKRLTKGGQVASGVLRASVTHRVIDRGVTPTAEVGTNIEYAKKVEFGSAPGELVPIRNLIKWLKRKGYSGDDMGLAYKVQESIYEKGTKPHAFLLPALLENSAAINATIKKELAKYIANYRGKK